MKCTTLIIGLGNIGLEYDYYKNKNYLLSHAKSVYMHKNFELIGGIDPSKIQQDKFKLKYNVNAFSNIEYALKKLDPKLCIISNPTNLHLKTIREVLEKANPIAILCEKPLSYKINDASKIVKLCHEKGCKIYVNYMRRCDPAVIKLRKYFKFEKFKPPYRGIVWYSKGLYNNGSHFLNLLETFFGKVISFKLISKSINVNEDIEADIIFYFRKATIYFLACEEKFYSHYTFEIISANGRLRYDDHGNKIYWQRVINDKQYRGYKKLTSKEKIFVSETNKFQHFVLENLYKSINHKPSYLCTGEEALKTTETLNQIRIRCREK